jgi:hypothetical protein
MIKSILGLLVAIAAFLLTSGFQQTAKRNPAHAWIQFQSKEGAFSILMPKQPIRQTEQVETASGIIESNLFKATFDRVSYQIGYFDLAFTPSEDDQINKVLDGGRDGGLASAKGQLISETHITLDGYLGREIKAKLPNGFLISRFYLVKQRMYGTVVETRGGEIDSATATIFLDSFKLITTRSSAEQAGWVEFSSVEGGFTVWMPGKPVEEAPPLASQEALQKIGASVHIFLHTTPKRIVFLASYSDLEGDYKAPKANKDYLDGVRSGQLSAVKDSKLLSEKMIWIEGHPGREFLIKTPIGITRSRVCLVGNRSYQLLFITPLNIQDKINMGEMFLDSFKLVKRQKV